MKKLLTTLPLLSMLLISCGKLDKEGVRNQAHAAVTDYKKSKGGGGMLSGTLVRVEDLNDDQQPDAIAHIRNDAKLCSAQGCPMLVLENQGSRLRLVSVTQNVHERVGTFKRKNGWTSLLVSSKQPNGKRNGKTVTPTTYRLDFQDGYPKEVTQGTRQ